MFNMAVAIMELFSHLSNSVKIKPFVLSVTHEESASPQRGASIRGSTASVGARSLSSCPCLSLRKGEARAGSLQEKTGFVVWAVSNIMYLENLLPRADPQKKTVCSVTLWATAGASARALVGG